MPGIHTFLKPLQRSTKRNYPFIPVEENPINKLTVILQDNAACLYITHYEGYPFSLWQTNNQIILLEGIIYNQSIDKIENQLKAISQCFYDDGDYNKFVKAFVEAADGDFIVEIWDKHTNRLLLFNNYWGRLSLYYYSRNGMCGISREIKDLLSFVPEINLDKTSLVEFLYFEFPLGNKTLFKDIYRLGPASMIVVNVNDDDLEFKLSHVVDITFDLKEQFAHPSDAVEILKELFLQSVQSRVQTLVDGKYQLVADLSGGFDSRAVIGGLEKVTHDVFYCTQTLNTNDQRKWGQAIFEVLGSPGKFVTATPDHSYKIEKLSNFVYQYDCMANFSVGYNSNQVVKALKEIFPKKVTRFMGFGGEFLRHPLKVFHNSLIYGIDHGFYFYSNIILSDVCRLLGISYLDYYNELDEYLKTYPEQTPEGQLRRLYFEYFNHYVNTSEDYCRKYIWTVSPFWGSMLFRTIMERVPLEWTGFKFFTHFMNALDPRLLLAPIFGKSVRLDSKRSVDFLETKEGLKNLITTFLPAVHYFYKNVQAKIYDNEQWEKIKPVIRDIKSKLILPALPGDQLILNESNVLVSRRYLTLLLYLQEVEKLFSGKILS